MNLKEDALAFPLLMSGLAICYDVGSFDRIGYFAIGFFSLAEHIQFALAGLKAGFTLALAAFAGFILPDYFPENWKWSVAGRWRVGRFAALCLCLALAIGLLFYGTRHNLLVGIAVGSFVLCVTIIVFAKGQKYYFVFVVIGVVSMALNMGRVEVEMLMLEGNPVTLRTKDRLRSVFVIRAGERGLISYNPATNEMIFDRWDEAKSLEWRANPIGGLGVR